MSMSKSSRSPQTSYPLNPLRESAHRSWRPRILLGSLLALLGAGAARGVAATAPVTARGIDPIPGQERYLKDSDLKKVGASLTAYLEARDEGEGVTEAEVKLKAEISKLEKKLAKTPAKGNLLASPGDLGRALWLSFDYDHKKRIAKAGKVSEQKTWDDYLFTKKDPLNYAVWTPEKYRPKTDAYTLILLIPDEGEKPFDCITEDWTDPGLRSAIIAAPAMPEDTSLWEENDGFARVLGLYKELTNNWAIDFDRIYLAGQGRGVQTAVTIASIWPERFAGVIGRRGEVGAIEADNFSNLPCYFAGGGPKTEAFGEQAKALGYDGITLQPDGLEEDIWTWIQAHPRNSYPSHVVLLAAGRTTRMYWLAVPLTSDSTLVRLEATIDKESNTVTVEGVGATEFTLYFSDALLDLDKEVTVVANGEVYKDKIPRSFRQTVNSFYKAAIDPGKVLVASKFYHLPAPAEEGGDGD